MYKNQMFTSPTDANIHAQATTHNQNKNQNQNQNHMIQ